MFINKLDKFIELEFYSAYNYIIKNKFLKNLKKDKIEVYYQKLINKINYTDIFETIINDSNKRKIQNIIEKYILFYLILTLCIIDDLKVDNDNNDKVFLEKLFNISNEYPILDSIYIGELLEIYKSYYISLTLLKLLNQNKDIASIINEENIEVINIFNDIGIDNIKKFFDLKNNGQTNIIVTLLFNK